MGDSDEVEPISTMTSYAFKNFSPHVGQSTGQGRSLRTYASNLFKRFEELQQLSLYSSIGPHEMNSEKNSKESEDGDSELLDAFSERAIKNWVGRDAYDQGLQYFASGCVTRKRVFGRVLSGIVDESTGISRVTSHAARIEFFRKRKTNQESDKGKSPYHHVSAWCQCLESQSAGGEERLTAICGHIAALLISWSKNPESFERSSKISKLAGIEIDERELATELARSTTRVFSSLEEMISVVLEESKSSKAEVLDVLQMLYSSIRVSSSQIEERWKELVQEGTAKRERFETILGFSFIANMITSRILGAVDMKYKTGAMLSKNRSDVGATRKVIESFVDKQKEHHLRRKAIKKHRSKKGRRDTKVASRSWDRIVEGFIAG